MVSKDVKPGIIVMAFGFLGLILAGLEKYLVDNGYVLDAYLEITITVQDLQIVTIIFALLVGVIVAALTTS